MKYFLILLSISAFGKIEVQGHRGARAMRPENTLAAFEYALQIGVDTLEMDLCVTKDNVLVVSHDPILNPAICLDPLGKPLTEQVIIRTKTLKEIQSYDCGTLKNPAFPKQEPHPKEHIPTLEEVLQLVSNSNSPYAKHVRFNIETKSIPAYPQMVPPIHEFVQMIIDLVKKYNLTKRVSIQSFDHRTLAESKKIAPEIAISPLISDNFIDFVAITKSLHAEIISPDYQWITKEAVDALHKHGTRVIPWTVNKPEDWAKMISMGVDGIITDDPQALILYLQQNKIMRK